MALRTRLLLTLIAVVAFGLIVSDVATYTSLRSFLVGRTDPQLELASYPVSRQVLLSAGLIHLAQPRATATSPTATGTGVSPTGGFSVPRHFTGVPKALRPFTFDGHRSGLEPAGTVGELVNQTGRPIATPITFSYGGKTAPAPVLPRTTGTLKIGVDRFIDAHSAGARAVSYRVLERATGYRHLTIVVAIPLTDVDQTLHRLVLIELLATLAILVGLALLARWIVRRGLRPLEDMAVAAGDIARGDLARRVEPDGGPTEVGRLGSALNVMLGEIQEAFDSRAASEARLRRFVADASHELRTPLTSLRGYAELFEHNGHRPPEDLATAMRHIRREAERMSLLVDDLLVLANLDQVRPLHLTSVDLAAVVQEAVVALSFTGHDHAVRFEGEGEIRIECDADRVRRAVDNLLTNAARYSPAGSAIDVIVRSLSPAAGDTANAGAADRPAVACAEIEVRDQGPGVTSEEAARIFEPFYRADTSRTRHTGGTGLGLAIVAATVEAHHGTLGVRPNPPGGSCFWLRLPVHHEEGSAADVEPARAHPAAPDERPSRGVADGPALASGPTVR
ncbi:MAG TPA: ATP-binding protein [Acidimicrobiales bacterium]|nr:ATP-binding protein [Acidimicrobiales bacterium]